MSELQNYIIYLTLASNMSSCHSILFSGSLSAAEKVPGLCRVCVCVWQLPQAASVSKKKQSEWQGIGSGAVTTLTTGNF